MAVNTEYATPILIGEAGTVVRMGMEVTVASTGVVRLALRKNLNNFPGPLIGQVATIDGTSATVQEATVSWEIPTPGIYWMTATAQGGAPAVRAIAGNFAPVSWSTLASAMSATPLAGYISASTFTGTLTDTYTIAGRTGAPPLMTLRF